MPMSISLTEWMQKFHQTPGIRTPSTWHDQARYEFTFDLFHRFLERELDRPATVAAMTTATMEDFAIWLRDTRADSAQR